MERSDVVLKRSKGEKKNLLEGGENGDPEDPDNGEDPDDDDTIDDDAVESDNKSPNDQLYRQIFKELMKASKNYKIKELSMASDPSI